MKRLIIGMLLGALMIIGLDKVVHAQSAAPIQIQSSVVHTSCTITPSVTTYCFGNDGLWVSLSGAAYTQIGGAGAVTSVNGKTGAVILSATTTSTTTVN